MGESGATRYMSPIANIPESPCSDEIEAQFPTLSFFFSTWRAYRLEIWSIEGRKLAGLLPPAPHRIAARVGLNRPRPDSKTGLVITNAEMRRGKLQVRPRLRMGPCGAGGIDFPGARTVAVITAYYSARRGNCALLRTPAYQSGH